MGSYASRIVCLTEETTETLYLLGQEQRIVGISGFTVRPPRARQEKPKVSAFTSARVDRILDLKPDLAIGFSDIQADIAQALIKAGVEVWIANHRSVEQILGYVLRLGALVGAADRARLYVDTLQAHVDGVRASAASLPRRPRVYFEEWDEPAISAIRWVSELIGIAGGDDVRTKTFIHARLPGNCNATPKVSGGISSRSVAYFAPFTRPMISYTSDG